MNLGLKDMFYLINSPDYKKVFPFPKHFCNNRIILFYYAHLLTKKEY